MTRTLCMEMDEEVLLGMNKNPEELAREMRLAAAVKWYEMGMISQERAAQLSGMSRAAFIAALSNFGVSPFQETSEEILDALDKSGK
jgi:predicted HTH domain antitoxin